MYTIFSSSKKNKFSGSFLILALLALLAGCGGGGATSTDDTTPSAPSLILTLTDSTTNATVTAVSATAPGKVTATLKDAAGAPVKNSVVTFTITDPIATMEPAAGTALTDSAGVATIKLIGSASSGATTITGTTTVGTTSVSGSIGFTVTTGSTATVTLTTPLFGVNTAPFAPAPLATYGTTPGSLSAFGTTGVAVAVSVNGVPATSPQTVDFSSSCAAAGKAVLSASATTIDGVATASYRDNGCAGADIITARVSGNLATSSATLTVIAPATGSIQFVSATPTNISLKGTGGTETSQLTFKVLDSSGNPVSGKSVTFALSTTVGGITLTPNTGVSPFATGSAVSDASGLVITNVNSGTVSTPVRVTATTLGASNVSLTTQSNQLTISTGIPDQFGFSIAASALNIEGWNYDGVTSVLTVRLADHFKNPVPDGTAVTFTAEGGSIVSNCSTVAGACSATFTSQEGRPADGRITILAYAVGEETFTDLNGNGWADLNEMIDPNNGATDLPEAWVDYNLNGSRDANEPFIDFNGDGIYNGPDGKFSGALCDEANSGRSSAGSCAANHTLDVRKNIELVLSSSTAVITINNGIRPIVLASCVTGTGLPINPTAIPVTVLDVNGNPMAAGTTVEFATTNGTFISDDNYLFPDSTSSSAGVLTVTAQTDATYAAPDCTNAATSGTFSVKVTTPKGTITNSSATITD